MACLYVQWNNFAFIGYDVLAAEKRQHSKKHQIDDICVIFFFVEKVSQLSKNVLMMVMGFASKFTLVLFKLIAVIDCASKMMMMLCSCGWRVIPCFLLQIFFNITLFVTFLLRTIEEFFFVVFVFLPDFFFRIIHKYWTRNSFYSIFGFDFAVLFFNRVSNFQKPIQQIISVVCACLNAD